MAFPNYYETIYGTTDDAELTELDGRLNTALLRGIIDGLFIIKFIDGEFTTSHNFRIRFEDRHSGETTPHYVLDFGDGDKVDNSSAAAVVMRYIDNHSAEANVIKQPFGMVKISVYGYFGKEYSPEFVAKKAAYLYQDCMKEIYRRYYIVFGDPEYVTP